LISDLKNLYLAVHNFVMRLKRVLIGEFIIIIASVLIFRSIWTLMDEYLGTSYLLIFLALGLILTLIGLLLLNQELALKAKL